MVTVLLVENNKETVTDIIKEILSASGNTRIGIMKHENMVKILDSCDVREMVSLSEKVISLGEALYVQEKGGLYDAVIKAVEKPFLEYVLKRADGNQLKAARMLGINRNTLRTKIRKLGISIDYYKTEAA